MAYAFRLAGCLMSLLLVGAAPIAPQLAGCSQALTPVESGAADALARALATAAEAALDKVAQQSPATQEKAIEDAIEATLESSDASPLVGRTALQRAQATLTAQGLICAVNSNPSAPERTCDAVRKAFELAMSAAQAAGRICAGAIGGGPSPLGLPLPPPSGGGGNGPGVTHPSVPSPA